MTRDVITDIRNDIIGIKYELDVLRGNLSGTGAETVENSHLQQQIKVLQQNIQSLTIDIKNLKLNSDTYDDTNLKKEIQTIKQKLALKGI